MAKMYSPTSHSSNVVLLVVALVIIAGGYLILRLRPNDSRVQPTPATHPSRSTGVVLADIENQLGVTETISSASSGEYTWILPDGRVEPLAGSTFELTRDPKLGPVPTASITETQLVTVTDQLDQSFRQSGLNLNRANTRDHPSDLITFQRAYEGGGLECIADLVVATSPFGTVFCGLPDARQAAWQATIFPTLFPTANAVNSDTYAYIENVVGGFARGQAGSRQGGGYYWIAQRQGSGWKLIFSGQDYPTCNQIDQFQVPRSIYKNCYDSKLNSLRFSQ